MKKIKALLIDLDGTIYQNEELIKNTLSTIKELEKQKIQYRFITNSTTKSKKSICVYLDSLGLTVNESRICTTWHAASTYCFNNNISNVKILTLAKNIESDLNGLNLVDSNPEAIILGDLGHKFNYEILNEIFLDILNGAELIALHKNRYWLNNEKIVLDLGPFVSLLEYSANKNAIIIGKPNNEFFKIASSDFNLSNSNIAVIGDDIDADVKGAQDANMIGILVKTGKYIEEEIKKSNINPNYIIDSFSHILDYL